MLIHFSRFFSELHELFTNCRISSGFFDRFWLLLSIIVCVVSISRSHRDKWNCQWWYVEVPIVDSSADRTFVCVFDIAHSFKCVHFSPASVRAYSSCWMCHRRWIVFHFILFGCGHFCSKNLLTKREKKFLIQFHPLSIHRHVHIEFAFRNFIGTIGYAIKVNGIRGRSITTFGQFEVKTRCLVCCSHRLMITLILIWMMWLPVMIVMMMMMTIVIINHCCHLDCMCLCHTGCTCIIYLHLHSHTFGFFSYLSFRFLFFYFFLCHKQPS